MATILNSPIDMDIRLYHDMPNLAEDDMSKIPDIAEDGGMLGPELEANVKQIAKSPISPYSIREITYDFHTKNKSFIDLYKDYCKLGIKNNKFHLAIIDRSLIGIDPFDQTLPLETKLRIDIESKRNPWYWLREVCRIPMDGKPIAVGGGSCFLIDRNSAASWYLFLNNIDQYTSKPRQTGKTQNALAQIDWAFHFGAMSSTFTFSNKDATNNRMNLYRLKCQRDMLPAYMQMRIAMDRDGNIVKESNNVTTMKNPITSNSITLLPRANSAELANSNGRGMTASLQYFDEFDFTNYQVITLKSSVFAFNTAHNNAIQNGSCSSRIFSSTPGDLDTRDGAAAAEFISHMLVWQDKFLDMPIRYLLEQIHDRKSQRNGIVYAEHSWKQLKKTQAWYEQQCESVSYDKETILREIDLKRLHGSSLSPFDRDSILYIQAHQKAPIAEIDLSNNLCPIYFYEKIRSKIPYILSIDPSEGLGTDNNSIQLINPYTLQTAAEYESPYISQPDLAKMVVSLMDNYCPKSMIVVENNRGRELINCLRQTKYMYQIWYDSKKMLEVTEKVNQYGAGARDAFERRAYGINTGTANRAPMYAILESFMHDFKERLVGAKLVQSITALIRKPGTGRIEAGDGQHDDSVMAYLIGVYVFLHAENLESFGLYRGMADPDLNTYLAQKKPVDPIDKLKEMFSSLPQEMQDLLGPELFAKTEQEETAAYNREVEIAKMQSPYSVMTQTREDNPAVQSDPNAPNLMQDQDWDAWDHAMLNLNDDMDKSGNFNIDDYV